MTVMRDHKFNCFSLGKTLYLFFFEVSFLVDQQEVDSDYDCYFIKLIGHRSSHHQTQKKTTSCSTTTTRGRGRDEMMN